jgi:hypothetical protein
MCGQSPARAERADSATVETRKAIAKLTTEAGMTNKLPDGNRGPGSVPPALIVAGWCAMGVIAVWAPVARAQLIFSAVAILAVWIKRS